MIFSSLIKKQLLSLFCVLFLNAFFPFPANAANVLDSNLTSKIQNQSLNLTEKAGLTTGVTIGSMAKIIIEGFLGLLSIIFIVLIIVAGYSWMTAAGDESKVTYAKDTMKRAVIGIIIIVSAYAITAFVFKRLPMGDSTSNSSGYYEY